MPMLLYGNGMISGATSMPTNVQFGGTVGVTGALNTSSTFVSSGALTASAGIVFPATQNASANANTLDDYEEGSWTPTDVSGAGLTLSSGGAYVKIGGVVTIWASVTFPSNSNGLSNQIGNIPFPNNNPGVYSGAMSICGHGSSDILPMLEDYRFQLRTYNNGAYSNANLSGKFYYFWATYTTS